MMNAYLDFQSRYRALEARDPEAEGMFVYAVTSTSIVCRPTCSSRVALAKNVIFFDTVEKAIKSGFRPCRRCRPEVESGWNKSRNSVSSACSIMNQWAQTGKKLDVDQLAKQVSLSKWHFCRVFKNYTNYTPRKFYLLCREGLFPVPKLPLIRTKRFLARSKARLDLIDQSLENTLVNCEDNGDGVTVAGFAGLESSDLDLLEVDWYALLNPTYGGLEDSILSSITETTSEQSYPIKSEIGLTNQ